MLTPHLFISIQTHLQTTFSLATLPSGNPYHLRMLSCDDNSAKLDLTLHDVNGAYC